jgi:hypothetical protein
MFRSGPLRCTQKAVTSPVAQEGDSSDIRATGAILGPRKATLRGHPALFVVFEYYWMVRRR